MLPPAPAWVREEKWTAEQQKQEMERRSILLMKLNSVPLRYRPRPTDVVVATFPKNGTTWVLHICHQLRMRGAEPDFADQEDVLSLLPLGLSAGRVLGVDGCLNSLDWTTGLDYWTGLLDWTTGLMNIIKNHFSLTLFFFFFLLYLPNTCSYKLLVSTHE